MLEVSQIQDQFVVSLPEVSKFESIHNGEDAEP